MTRRMNRRQVLAAAGTVSLGSLLAACGAGDEPAADEATPTPEATATVEPKRTPATATAELFDESASCELTPQATEGPYYFDVDSIRSDIREDREGTRLRLALRVRDAGSCEPIENAVVDLWHCDAQGGYSGFEGGEGDTFLRGAQVTNAEGIAEFTTVYPGFYGGRTVHIHAKVHLDRQTVLTTQLYFDEATNEQVFARAPYNQAGDRDVVNDEDGIFDAATLLTLRDEGGKGVLGVMTFDVQNA